LKQNYRAKSKSGIPARERKPPAGEWAWLNELTGEIDDDFIAAVNEDPGEPTPRPEIDEFFRK
jgi:hypothetical protein